MQNKAHSSTPLYPKATDTNITIAGIINSFPKVTQTRYFKFFHMLLISISPPRAINAIGVAAFAISEIVFSIEDGRFICNVDAAIPSREPIIKGFFKILRAVFL